MTPIQINATTLPDAWFQALYNIFDHGRLYTIDRGSFEGQKRLEYPYITIHIKNPGVRPLLPEIPEGLNIPAPVSQDYLDQYMPYLMSSELQDNEQYTYGQYLEYQIAKVIKMYKEQGPNTNQACMTLGDMYSIDQADPPCWKLADTRIINNKLHFVIYFRSNDLYSGFPCNLAGIQLLKEYMASEIGVEDGEIIYSSKGLHLYDYQFDLALCRTGRDKNDIPR